MFNIVLTDKIMAHLGNGQLQETSEEETRSYQSYTLLSASENPNSKNALNNKSHDKCLIFT